VRKIFVSVAAVVALFAAGCSSCPNPVQSAAPADCAPPVALASEQPSPCGPLPPEALPGQIWCCEAIAQAAPPPARVCTCPESVQRVQVPAEYETVTEQVEVSPSRTEWTRVECATGSGECWALVEIPAVFETRSRQRLVREAYETLQYSPAVFENVAAAPAEPIYRWVRHQECEPTAPAPAGVVTAPPPPPAPIDPPAGTVPAPIGR
jgi:hypothetical protein